MASLHDIDLKPSQKLSQCEPVLAEFVSLLKANYTLTDPSFQQHEVRGSDQNLDS